MSGIRHTPPKTHLNSLVVLLGDTKLLTENSYMLKNLDLLASLIKSRLRRNKFYLPRRKLESFRLNEAYLGREKNKRKQTSRQVFGTYRSDLFRFYNEIQNRKVAVSGNRGVREIGQHTVSSANNINSSSLELEQAGRSFI